MINNKTYSLKQLNMIFICKIELKKYRILQGVSPIKQSQTQLIAVQIETSILERMLLKYMKTTT